MNAPLPPGLVDLRDRLSAINADLADARHLPGYVYTSPEIAELERDRIFMRRWLAVAREEELANPGDYMSLRIAGEPIVISRDKTDGIVAWENRCLHRGVEVAFGQGNARLHTCPYHAWSYSPGGKLVGAPLVDQPTRERAGTQMVRLKTALWRGWVFVNFDPQAVPFEQFIAPMEKELWWYRTGECRIAEKLVLEVNCNWKFIAENLIDWYHAGTVHAGTFGRYYKFDGSRLPAKLLPEGCSTMEFDEKGRDNDPNLPFPKMPWLEDRKVFSAKGVIFPNINFWSGADSLRMWHLWPEGAGKTRAICYILVPESSLSVPEFKAKMEKYSAYVKQVAVEDRAALESLQRGVGSPRYKPGPLMTLEEQLQHLLKFYVEAMTA